MVLYIFLSELFIVFPNPPENTLTGPNRQAIDFRSDKIPILEEKGVFSLNTLVRAMRHRCRSPHTK
jgi:hypothetical protein